MSFTTETSPASPAEMTVSRRTDGQIVLATFVKGQSWSDSTITLNDAAATWLASQLVTVLGGTVTERPARIPDGLEHMKKHYPAVYRAFVLEAPQTGSEGGNG